MFANPLKGKVAEFVAFVVWIFLFVFSIKDVQLDLSDLAQ